jgi:threonine/homoserine/homoserine lactone efflux protein
MRAIAIIVAILGLASFIYGILFVAQASTAAADIATFQRTSGTVDIIIGLGMFLSGVWMLMKSRTAA